MSSENCSVLYISGLSWLLQKRAQTAHVQSTLLKKEQPQKWGKLHPGTFEPGALANSK